MQKALALLLSAAMLLCLHPAAAQQPNTLTGTVTDSASGKAVGYATVSLQRDSVTVVNAVAADSDGRFSLKAPETGDYQLCITMVGYTPYKQAVEVPASSKALGKIAITQGVEVGDADALIDLVNGGVERAKLEHLRAGAGDETAIGGAARGGQFRCNPLNFLDGGDRGLYQITGWSQEGVTAQGPGQLVVQAVPIQDLGNPHLDLLIGQLGAEAEVELHLQLAGDDI